MASPTLAEIDKVVFAKDTAKLMTDYVESIVLDDDVIAGDRYKVTFSERSEWGDENG